MNAPSIASSLATPPSFASPSASPRISATSPRGLPRLPRGVPTVPRLRASPVVCASADVKRDGERVVGTGGSVRSGGPDSEFVDTRIHWNSPTEGWIGAPGGFGAEEVNGGAASGTDGEAQSSAGLRAAMSRDMQLLIMSTANNHYSILGLSPLADTDAIKSAYRRLSKRYHPDTTALPLQLAEQQFMRLNEAYQVLASAEDRRLYDWKLAREASDVRGGRFVWPYEVDQSQRGMGSRRPSPAVQSGAGKQNPNDIPLSGQSVTALAFDAFAILVAVACIVYAAYFKQH